MFMFDENKVCLFITHSYPSINSPNSLCVQKLVDNRPNDIIPIVLCYRFPGQKKHEVVDGVEIHRIKKDWFWPIEGLARYPSRSNRFNPR